MNRKKRGYGRTEYKESVTQELQRDYKLFAIACEGKNREPDYFKLFNDIKSKRLVVDVIEDLEQQNSAPRWVLDRAVKYIENEGLIDEDELWFVMDIDRWKIDQLYELAAYCDKYSNWHIVLSNPCFEVWLYLHKKADIANSASENCKDFKGELTTLVKGGYHPYKFIPHLEE